MRLARRLLPGGVLLLAATLLLHVAAVRESVSTLLPVLPYVVFGGGVFLSWRFHRTRLALALLALALADRALFYFAAGEGSASETGRVVFGAVALLLPVNLMVLSWISERGLWTPRGRVTLGLLLGQVAAVAWLSLSDSASLAGVLEHRLVDAPAAGAMGLPQPALLAFGLAFAFTVFRIIRHPTALESGSLWALVAAFLALTRGAGGAEATVYLTSAGVVLVVSLIETSYGMAYSDELTGLPGRRALNETLRGLGDRYTIAMVDIDYFKRFNDEHGHDVGDQLLRMVASKLENVGGGGRAFRYGGEEFSVIFPGKSTAEAVSHLEGLRKAIEASAFTVRGRRRPRKRPPKPAAKAGREKVIVTVSAGVAGVDRNYATPDQVVEAADNALYRAKAAGRNRIAT